MLLDVLAGGMVKRALTDTDYYQRVARPLLYAAALGDPERAHRYALAALNDAPDAVAAAAERVRYRDLEVDFCGRRVLPFGTAAGLDKDCDALVPLSKLFGFQEVGTIVVEPRRGNARPRVLVTEDAAYNAQGFPSKGLAYARERLERFREKDGRSIVLASECGLPSDAAGIGKAREEHALLVRTLRPYVNGIVWNPYSPNTEALQRLRTPEEFSAAAQIAQVEAPDKLRLAKMGPYDDEKRWLELADAWMRSGGHGLVMLNTRRVRRDAVPAKRWGYDPAGRSGGPLLMETKAAVRLARGKFPRAVLVAAGGIGLRLSEDAWELFVAGADAVEGYTPYIIKGFGLLGELADGVRGGLRSTNQKTLRAYLSAGRSRA